MYLAVQKTAEIQNCLMDIADSVRMGVNGNGDGKILLGKLLQNFRKTVGICIAWPRPEEKKNDFFCKGSPSMIQ